MRIAPLLVACALALPAVADEGLWPYNQFPTDAVKKLGFEASPAFLDHLRLSSVRIGGGSGAFVSAKGLVITSRQIANACLTANSTPQRDYFQDGFQASGESAEPACKGMTQAFC